MNLFEITIQHKSNKGWPITALRYQTGDLLPVRSEDYFNIDMKAVNAALYIPEDYGALLGKSVFRGEIEKAFIQALTDAKGINAKLRVLLFIEADDLRNLRWERLCAPTDRGWDFLQINQQTPYSLYLPSLIDRRFPPLNRSQMKALILVAGPEELKGNLPLPSFDVEASVRNVSDALEKIPHQVLASSPHAIGKPNLENLCQHIAANRFTLLHIVCHGAFKPENKETILFFPDENGYPVTTSELIKRFKRLTPLPHFTFLSSCESASPNAETGLGGTAQRLVRELGMPAVLAMADKISVRTIEKLTHIFYSRLYEHGEVDLAVADALVAIQGEHDVTTPVLFSRLGNRPLFCEKYEYILNQQEIRDGLTRLKREVEIRAPILGNEFQSLENSFIGVPDLDNNAIQNITTKANELCGEIFDNFSFSQFAMGEKVIPYDNRCPFPGIGPFKVEDSSFFFGRESLVEEVLRRLIRHPFLAISGPSGSGKSSLVLAGLKSRFEDPQVYLVPGNHPIEVLDQSIASIRSSKSVVIVDQFEELFTITKNPNVRALFVDHLIEILQEHKVIVVIRSDFLGECAQYENLRLQIEKNLLLVSPIDASTLPQVAQHQADMVNLHFDDGLLSKIIEDVIEEPGAMSLLQHALWCLWERRRGRWLRYNEYMAFGGIKKAIVHTASEFYSSLSNDDKVLVREIFLRLVRLDENLVREHRDTRRKVALNELVPVGASRSRVVELVKDLANIRLVVSGIDEQTKLEQVELAHEALIQYWPQLKEWLNEDREKLLLRDSIRTAAQDWGKENRENNMLVHRGGRLDDAIELTKLTKYPLNTLELEYVNACFALREQEYKEIDRRRKRIIFGLVTALLITIGLTIFAFIQRAEMQRQRQRAIERLILAQTQLLDIRVSKNAILKFGLAIEAFSRLQGVESYDALWSGVYIFRPKDMHIKTNGPVTDICFSPDSQNLISITDRSIQIWGIESDDSHWNVVTDEPKVNIDLVNPDTITYSNGKVLCNPDNKTIIAIFGKTLDKWDMVTGNKLVEMFHNDVITDAALSPDGNSIVSGSQDGELKLWNADTGALEKISLSDSGIQHVLFSSDGKQIVSSDASGRVIVWNMASNEVNTIDTGQPGLLLALSPDSQWLVTGGGAGEIFIWDTASRIKSKTIFHRENITNLTFSPDGNLLFSSSGDDVSKVWSVPSFTPVSGIGTFGQVNSANFSPDNQYIILGGYSGYTMVYELGKPDLMEKMIMRSIIHTPSEDQINKTIFNREGDLLASASVNGDILISPVTTNNLLNESQVWHIEFSDQDDLIVTASRDGTAKIHDTITGKKVLELKHRGWVNYATFSPVSNLIATASSDDTAKVWSLVDGKELLSIKHNDDVYEIKFSPDGKLVATAGWDGIAQIWQIDNKTQLFQIRHNLKINRVLFSQNNEWIITASDDKSIKGWDISRKTEILHLSHDAAVTDVGITPSNKYIIAGDEDGNVKVWNIENGSVIFSENMGTSNIQKIAVSPDGQLFAAGNKNGKVCVWQLLTGKSLLCFNAEKAIWDLIFSNSDYILAGSSDTVVYIWDLISLSEYGQIRNDGLVLSLDLSSDNKWIAMSTTAGYSRYVIWKKEDMLDEACRRIPRQLTITEWNKYLREFEYNPFCLGYSPKN